MVVGFSYGCRFQSKSFDGCRFSLLKFYDQVLLNSLYKLDGKGYYLAKAMLFTYGHFYISIVVYLEGDTLYMTLEFI